MATREELTRAEVPAPGRLAVGQVRGVHGLRGVVRVEVLTDDPTRFEPGSPMHLEDAEQTLTVAWVQDDGPGLLVRFEEIASREMADALRERYLEVPHPGQTLPDGEYYWHELMEVPVLTEEGETLGTVVDIFRAGGGEILVVRGGRRGEILVPTVKAVVRELSPRSGRIVVDREALGLETEPAVPRPRGRRTTRALKRADALPGAGSGSAVASDATPAMEDERATS
ncbi:MAG: 16S rRNA processing protein RimM [Chloroflexi bacterium]|nr:16S rRNA processing protein RimM [Chloroflexota bacterium]